VDKAVDKWRLWRLKVKRNHAARQDALASVREAPGGYWLARVGGRMRGTTIVAGSRSAAEAMVHAHYNELFARFNREANYSERFARLDRGTNA